MNREDTLGKRSLPAYAAGMSQLAPNALTLPEPWPTTIEEARAVQERMRGLVRLEPLENSPRLAAGIDVGLLEDGLVRAAVAVLDVSSLALVESALAVQPAAFPYVPGFLSFREIPPVLEALGKLNELPDLLVCDGQGIAHPRGFGIASHLGVLTGLPSLGVAKSRLVGRYTEPGSERGSRSPLLYRARQIGWVLRTRTGVKPVFVSPGHRLDLDGSLELALALAPKYRLPETTRQAHNLASGHRMKSVGSKPSIGSVDKGRRDSNSGVSAR